MVEKELRATRVKDEKKNKGPTTMNVTLSFCMHTHTELDTRVCVCEKSLPHNEGPGIVVAPLFCLIIYMSKQLRVQFS